MSRTTWHQWIGQFARRRQSASSRRRRAVHPVTFERLDSRITPSVTAVFVANAGLLAVIGDAADNTITVGRNAAGALHVNGGAVPIIGGAPTVANTARIQILGLAGNDHLALDETNGALPTAHLFGGRGNDILEGGSSADRLFGEGGNDTLFGRGGLDMLFGGADDDTLTGGDGNDLIFGNAGNDRMIWNPGDDTDLNEGGAGMDTSEINGGGGDEVFTTIANGTRVRFDRLDPAPFSIDIGSSENLVLNANGGNDQFSATGNLAALIKITVDGGAGNDTLLGSNGVDVLLGGDGDDLIDGQQGNDVAFLGAGNDVFQWDPGDGSDTVEGQDGTDTLLFNGSNGAEIFNATANGSRVQFTRNLGNIVMDLDGIERLDLKVLGGSDTTVIGDLSGTSMAQVDVDQSVAGGGGDSQPDTVIVNATAGADTIEVTGSGTSVAVTGVVPLVNVTGVEGANDALVINALDGDDSLTAATVAAGIIKLTLDGGDGKDTITGSQGADIVLAGAGDDSVDAQQGNDLLLLGSGNDVALWESGDGSDTIEGQDGTDRLRFFGSDADENFDLFAVGGRVHLLRNVGSITMDMDNVEQVELFALDGIDNTVVGDLSGTDLTHVTIDLAGPANGGDGKADTITVNATQADDNFGASGDANGVTVFGLLTEVRIVNQQRADDRLTLNALGGNDQVDATALKADGIQLTINGGLGNDVLKGSEGDDLFNGGDGNDVALMGAGDDVFVWNPGDDNDTLEGQAGTDVMIFNGANVAENINIAANGNRVRFFRDVASVTMDLDDMEQIDFNALGGADTIVVEDLSGTDATELNMNLAAANGSGDASPDTVIVNGTAGDDVVLLVGDATGTSVLGLATRINITGAESANDRVSINTLAGDDVVDGTSLAAAAIGLTANGGDDNDILLGGDGADVLVGGNGDDVLLGGPGLDVLDGGPGDNVVIQ